MGRSWKGEDLRFGIMSLQINLLIPPEIPGDQVFAYLASFDQTKLVRELASKGFKLIEIGGDLSIFLPHTFEVKAIQELASVKDELNLSYTVHLPLWSVEPSTPLTPVRKGSVDALIDIVNKTKPLDPEKYVVHATGALAAEFYRMQIPDGTKMIVLRQFQSASRESLRTLLSETGLPSRKLAVETIEFPFDLTLELAEELDLSICLDTGHVLVGFSGPLTIQEALARSLPRLGEVHLHDGPWQGPDRKIGYGKDHKPLGAGDLNVKVFLDELENSNFNGPIIFELNLEDAVSSLEKIASLAIDIE
jgi:sugar phosphate isomerase/epimerase